MKMKKRILFVAPSSYPVNSPEAIVNIKLLEILGNNDYEIDLISKKIKWDNYPSTKTLEELNVSLKSCNVIEVDNKFNFVTLLQHLKVYFIFGAVFKGAHWALEVLNKCKHLLKRDYDYVLTKSSPSLLVGYYLKKRFGYKWIATWNDPYPHQKYPFPYGGGVLAKLPYFQRRILKIMETADIHIFPNDRIRDYMLKYLNVPIESAKVIPHLAQEAKDRYSESNNGRLRLIHAGNVRSPRNPKPLVEAFGKFINENGISDVELHFIGVVDDDLKRKIGELSHNGQIKVLPPVEYEESLALLKDYDIALIIEAPCEEGIFLPTKVGDYMTAQIPIYSISPKIGILNDLYKQDYIQYFSSVDSTDEILNELIKIYDDFKNNTIKVSKFNTNYSACKILNEYNSLS